MSLSALEPAQSVSAVISAYNAEFCIGRAIESILVQTRPAGEILIIDNGSTDNTRQQIESYGNQVRYLRQANGDAGLSWNTGIQSAKGEWIAFLDAADEWLPEKLKVQAAHLRRNKDLVWSYGDFYPFSGQADQRRPAGDLRQAEILLEGEEYFESYFAAFLAGFIVCIDTLIVKRQALFETGLFRVGQPQFGDMDLWFRLAYRRPSVGYINQPLATVYKDAPGRLAKQHESFDTCCDLIDRHLKLAAEHGQLEPFRPCAAQILEGLIRQKLIQTPKAYVGPILERYEDILNRQFVREMRLRMKWPRTAPMWLGLCSAIKNIGLPKQE